MSSPRHPRALRRAAWVSVVLHLVGLGLAAIGMRPGTTAFPLEERIRYLADAPLGWTLGWGIWLLCGLSLLYFVALACRHLADPRAVTLTFRVAIAAVAIDLVCDGLQAVYLPALAAQRMGGAARFLVVERVLGATGTIAANGLYSAAVALLTRSLARDAGLPRSAQALGYASVLAGCGMIAAGVTGDPRHLELATGPTILAFCAWTLAVARHLGRLPMTVTAVEQARTPVRPP